MELIVRTENAINFNWFCEGFKKIENSFDIKFKEIPKAGSGEFLNLPERLKNILKLDKPDLIISKIIQNIELPILSIEITKSAPLSQHIEQRIPRIVAAAENDVVPIYICPKIIKKNEHTYNFNPKHYNLLNKISDINKLPSIFFHYPDNDGVLLDDTNFPSCPKIEDENILKLFKFIFEVLKESNNFYKSNFSFFNNEIIKKIYDDQVFIGSKNNYNIEDLRSCEIITTDNLKDYLSNYMEKNSNWIDKTVENIPNRIKQRRNTLIFKTEPKKSRLFDHAGDPYVGMLSAFDYAFCRIGRNIEERETNLVYLPLNNEDSYLKKVFAKEGYNKFYKNSCPFKKDYIQNVEDQFKISHHLQYGCLYTKNKPLRIYGYFCDMMLFKDAILVF